MRKNSAWILWGSIIGFALSEARADWEANYTVTSTKVDFPKVTGKVYLQPPHLRVDSAYPFDLVAYTNAGSRQADIGVASFRIRLTSDLKKFSGQIPPCLAKDFEVCVQDFRLKKTGSEKCGDRTCDVFEGPGIGKDVARLKIWHPAGEKEAVLFKAILTKKNGSVITVNFTDISRLAREASFYVIPANYRSAGPIESFLPSR